MTQHTHTDDTCLRGNQLYKNHKQTCPGYTLRGNSSQDRLLKKTNIGNYQCNEYCSFLICDEWCIQSRYCCYCLNWSVVISICNFYEKETIERLFKIHYQIDFYYSPWAVKLKILKKNGVGGVGVNKNMGHNMMHVHFYCLFRCFNRFLTYVSYNQVPMNHWDILHSQQWSVNTYQSHSCLNTLQYTGVN